MSNGGYVECKYRGLMEYNLLLFVVVRSRYRISIFLVASPVDVLPTSSYRLYDVKYVQI